jgi:heme/copper-type cytochrome/quinol oxidase subunit 2
MNKNIGIVVLVIAVAVGAIGYSKFSSSAASGSEAVQQSGDVAVIKLSSLPNGNYTNQKFEVKRGTKVRIEGDSSTLVGSMSQVIVDDYEVSKDITPGDNILEFVADKPGKFRIHCANGMGNAMLTVK